MKPDGTVPVPSFDLPISSLLDDVERAAVLRWQSFLEATRSGAPAGIDDVSAILAQRDYRDRTFFGPLVRRFEARHRVDVRSATLGGVGVEIFTPRDEAPPADRVLINLHGGGFIIGAVVAGRLESIPVSSTCRTTVVSVNYRLAPEHAYPAATEDVVAVYRELLRERKPAEIAIFGCSAGAVLTAQVVAALHARGMPVPGAVGMFFAAGTFWSDGDSGRLIEAMTGITLGTSATNPYLGRADPSDQFAFPANTAAMIGRFPPSLLLSATRDQALSSVAHTHSRLVASGVAADLHVWEGLGHAFFYDAGLPQTQQAYEVVRRFFESRLGS